MNKCLNSLSLLLEMSLRWTMFAPISVGFFVILPRCGPSHIKSCVKEMSLPIAFRYELNLDEVEFPLDAA
jgi:hypothetical protein